MKPIAIFHHCRVRLNMSPRLSLNDKSNQGIADVKLFGEPCLLPLNPTEGFSNVDNLIGGELSKAPSLPFHINHVLLLCSQLQMTGIATPPAGDALVQDCLAVRNCATMANHPSHPAGVKVPERVFSSTYAGVSSALYNRFFPRPTFVQPTHLNVVPKSFTKRTREDLIKNFFGNMFGLHQSVLLIVCRALGPAKDARAIQF